MKYKKWYRMKTYVGNLRVIINIQNNKIISRTFSALLFFCILQLAVGCISSNTKTSKPQVLSAPQIVLSPEKLQTVDSSFMFLRTFVDYYYDLSVQNKPRLPVYSSLDSFTGWCVGDAHLENFGFIIQKVEANPVSTLFTANDMDDSGPCPLILDLDRLVVSASLLDKNILQEEVLSKLHQAYLSGLAHSKVQMPEVLSKKQMSSLRKGFVVQPKKMSGDKFVRDTVTSEVNDDLKKRIQKLLPFYNVVDVVATVKKNGGSVGLKRYQALVLGKKNEFLHLEFKPLLKPAVAAVSSENIPDDEIRIANSVRYFQSESVHENYKVVSLDHQNYLIRPRYWGNEDLDMASLSQKEKIEVLIYEAYVLGRIHSSSLTLSLNPWSQAVQSVNLSSWLSELESFYQHYSAVTESSTLKQKEQK